MRAAFWIDTLTLSQLCEIVKRKPEQAFHTAARAICRLRVLIGPHTVSIVQRVHGLRNCTKTTINIAHDHIQLHQHHRARDKVCDNYIYIGRLYNTQSALGIITLLDLNGGTLARK